MESRSMMRKKNSEVPFSEATLLREKRAKQNNYQFLHRLSRKTRERVRLTRHLSSLVNDVANEIAKQVDPDTSVKVKGGGVLRVEEWTSHLETWKVLVFDNPKNKEDDGDEGNHEY